MERVRTQTIREFILDQADRDPRGIARRVAVAYGISRQAANRHLDLLVEAGLLDQSGRTRARVYRLRKTSALSREVRVTPRLNLVRLWEDHVAPVLRADTPGLSELCRGAFGELVRNAIEHAGASWIDFSFASNARDIDITVSDDGIGIFRALQPALRAPSPRAAAERIADLANARAFDSPAARLVLLARNFQAFAVRSAGAALCFDREDDAWTLEDDASAQKGTAVMFRARRSAAKPAAKAAGRAAPDGAAAPR